MMVATTLATQMSKLNTKIRIPTAQYAYVEVDFEGTPDEIKQKHDELLAIMSNHPIADDAFNAYLVRVVNSDITEWEDINYYEALSRPQKDVIQALKRFGKRLNAHLN